MISSRRGSATVEALVSFVGFVGLLVLAADASSLGVTLLRNETAISAGLGAWMTSGGSAATVVSAAWTYAPTVTLGGDCDMGWIAMGVPPLDATVTTATIRARSDAPVVDLLATFAGASVDVHACASHGTASAAEAGGNLLETWTGLLDGADRDLAPIL